MLGTLFLLLIMILLLLGIIFFFTPQPQEKPKQTFETTNGDYQKEQSKKESEVEKNKEGFSEKRWLTDKEIDGATDRMAKNDKFKILPAHQFHYVRETKDTVEASAHLAFPELLQELTSFAGDLVFIPVNNPDFHGSLLVYQAKSQKFWHYDTLWRTNGDYVQPLVAKLLQQVHQTNQPNLAEYLIPKHDIQQGNSYDCGVAVIAIIKRIIALSIKQNGMDKLKYGTFHLGDDLGGFDFPQTRRELREENLKENGTS